MTLIEFFRRIGERFFRKSPLFFRVVSWICNICIGIGLVQEFVSLFNITFPEPYNYLSGIVFITSAGILRLLSGLTVKKPKQWKEKETGNKTEP